MYKFSGKESLLLSCFISVLFILESIMLHAQPQPAYKLITVDPEHFHAALVQKSSYPQVDNVVYVYAPAGSSGLKSHLDLIDGYNHRSDNPTSWKEIVYTGDDFFEKMIREKKGNVVVLAGNNRLKTSYISRAIQAGLNVFADKPMVISSEAFPVLKEAFALADKKHLLLYDIMTERYQVTNALQKALAAIPSVFGELKNGTDNEPAVEIESVHHFFKTVSGKPLIRPQWYFDVQQQGDGMVDVTTHLVDMVQWQCFSNTAINYNTDINMLSAKRWPTVLTPSQFKAITGSGAYPDFLKKDLKDSLLQVYANGEMNYTLKGVHVKIRALWNYEAPAGAGDTHYEVLRGTKANLIIRQGAAEKYVAELYIEPVQKSDAYAKDLQDAVNKLAATYPGLSLESTAAGWKLFIPGQYRLSHEATFAEVTKKYLEYLQSGKLPEWEKQCMLAKYYTTTQALSLALKSK